MDVIETFKIKTKQKWTTKEKHHTIDAFIDLVENNLNNVKASKTKNLKTNLTKEARTAMKELAVRTVIMITNIRKAGATVIMNNPALCYNEMENNTFESF